MVFYPIFARSDTLETFLHQKIIESLEIVFVPQRTAPWKKTLLVQTFLQHCCEFLVIAEAAPHLFPIWVAVFVFDNERTNKRLFISAVQLVLWIRNIWIVSALLIIFSFFNIGNIAKYLVSFSFNFKAFPFDFSFEIKAIAYLAVIDRIHKIGHSCCLTLFVLFLFGEWWRNRIRRVDSLVLHVRRLNLCPPFCIVLLWINTLNFETNIVSVLHGKSSIILQKIKIL